jgi:hypothetical protein
MRSNGNAVSAFKEKDAHESDRQRARREDLVRWVELEQDCKRQVENYRNLERHYFAVEAERQSLEQYIKAGNGH